MKNPDPIAEAIPYVNVGFARFTTSLMITTGMLLRNAVEEAPDLPELYRDIWDEFFTCVDALTSRAAARMVVAETPEVAEALAVLKDAIREFGSIVSARLHSRNEEIWEASARLWEVFFPKGFDVVTEKQHDLVGWTRLNLHQWQNDFAKDIRVVYAERERKNVASALETYTQVAGRFSPPVEPEAAPKTVLELLNMCRAALRGVMLELAHLLKRQPEYQSIVMGMLRPLKEITETARSEGKKTESLEETSKGKLSEEKPAEASVEETASPKDEDEDRGSREKTPASSRRGPVSAPPTKASAVISSPATTISAGRTESSRRIDTS